MPGFFAQADAVIVSLRQNPIFDLTVPYKVQCYMACGRPILASIGGEGARVIQDSNSGIAVPPSSPQKLAAAVSQMMDMPAVERQKMGRCARNYYDKHYASIKVYNNLETWLQEAASQRN
jgi:glycosyltransferase involved in cell wall biosynthesis